MYDYERNDSWTRGARVSRTGRYRAVLTTVLAAALAACGSDAADPAAIDLDDTEGRWAVEAVVPVAGNEQTGPIETTLPEVLTVRVTRDGEALRNERLRWDMTGGGSIEILDKITDSNGLGRARVTLGSAVGLQRVGVRTQKGSIGIFTLTAVENEPPARVEQVHLDKGDATLEAGQNLKINAVAMDGSGNQMPGQPTWSTSDAAIATVDGEGLVTAMAAGTAAIRAQIDEASASLQVTVEEPAQPDPDPEPELQDPATVGDLTVASVSETSVTLRWTGVDDGAGNPARYSVRSASPTLDWGTAAETAKYVEGTQIGATHELIWTDLSAGTRYEFRLVSYRRSDDGSIAYGGLSNVVDATTQTPAAQGPSVTRVSASPATVALTALGAAFQLSAAAFDASGATVSEPVTWSSLQPGVAQVSSTGRVSAVSTGTARIVVSAACCTAADTVQVTVTQEASRVVITPSSLALTVGQTGSLSASVLDANGFPIAGAPITWSASNAAVASVNAGIVTANGAGTASVHATSGVLRGSVTVTVAAQDPGQPEPPVSGTSGAAFEENWDFSSTSELFAENGGRFNFPIWANTGGYLELATGLAGTPWGGSKAVRTHWGGGPYVGSINDEQIGIDVNLPRSAQATEIWIEIPLRYSSNFRVGSDHKTMFVFEEDGSRWEMRFGAYGNRAQAKLDNGNVQVATDASGRELDITNPVLVWDGQWHVLRLHLRTGSNGIFQAWLDGGMLINRSFSPGSASPFNKIALGRNGDPVEASDLWWGAVKVFTQNPGW